MAAADGMHTSLSGIVLTLIEPRPHSSRVSASCPLRGPFTIPSSYSEPECAADDGMKMRRHSKKRQEKPTVKGLTEEVRRSEIDLGASRLSIRCPSITQDHTPASHREFLDSHWPIYSPLLLRGDASQLAPPRYGPLWPLTFSPKEPNA